MNYTFTHTTSRIISEQIVIKKFILHISTIKNLPTLKYGQQFILNTSKVFESVTVEGNCCWKMLENESLINEFFPGDKEKDPSKSYITSIISHKCNASEVAQNDFTGNVYMYTLLSLSFLSIFSHTDKNIFDDSY